MPVTIENLAAEIKVLLSARPIEQCADAVCAAVSTALRDADLIARNLPNRAPGEHPRKVLYEDPHLGFCICGHVYNGPAESGPHDHGSSWAIYGQAVGTTEMSDWRIVAPGDPVRVVKEKTYILNPGDAHFYGVGAVHSPKRTGSTRLIRVEEANLDNVTRSNIQAA